MAVTKAKKTEQVEKLSKDLSNVSHMVVATYTKMTVSQDFELRKSVRFLAIQSVSRPDVADYVRYAAAVREVVARVNGLADDPWQLKKVQPRPPPNRHSKGTRAPPQRACIRSLGE